MRKSLEWWSAVCSAVAVAAFLLLLVFSAIGSACGMQIHSLVSADALRWMYTHFISNINAMPWGELIIALVAVSVVWRSGLLNSLRAHATLKQRRALSLTMFVLLLIVLVILALVVPPYGVLLSPFGTVARSPLLRGLFGALCLAAIILGTVYGLASGRFANIADVTRACIAIPRLLLPLLPLLIIASQIYACIIYVI